MGAHSFCRHFFGPLHDRREEDVWTGWHDEVFSVREGGWAPTVWNGTLMAYRTVVEFVDDFDGGEAHETVTFGLDGAFYRIDLSKDNAARLRQEFAVFIRHGRRMESTRWSAVVGPSVGGATRNQQIRSWARAAGLPIGDRGRIPIEITTMFRGRDG